MSRWVKTEGALWYRCTQVVHILFDKTPLYSCFVFYTFISLLWFIYIYNQLQNICDLQLKELYNNEKNTIMTIIIILQKQLCASSA